MSNREIIAGIRSPVHLFIEIATSFFSEGKRTKKQSHFERKTGCTRKSVHPEISAKTNRQSGFGAAPARGALLCFTRLATLRTATFSRTLLHQIDQCAGNKN